ncbi:MAG: hypothetical protein AB1813_10525 [Verrucomicrobiota bacterium]|jgi:hypothetical protein
MTNSPSDVAEKPANRTGSDQNLPEWLIAFAQDGREFVIHLHHPRFFVEAKPTDYRKWKAGMGQFDNENLDSGAYFEYLKRACQFYISEIYGLSRNEIE